MYLIIKDLLMSFNLLPLTLSSMLVLSTPVLAEQIVPKIYQIDSLSQIPVNYSPKTVIFFDLDDTVFDSQSMVGSKAWRKYIIEATKKLDTTANWHDIFTYFLMQKFPIKTVEENTNSFIKDLQDKGIVVCGLTARERTKWYDMPNTETDTLTVKQLTSVDVNFNNEGLENIFPDLSKDPEYFNGVFFANTDLKGDFLLNLFEKTANFPEKIIFIDDKDSQVESVAKALTQLGIPHECYVYSAIENKSKKFNPLVANIQLYFFYASDGTNCLSDEEAKIIAGNNPEKDAEYYLKAALEIAKFKIKRLLE